MKISIIMSVFNNSKTLKRSIESILNQDYENFEFLIMNDCSNDSSKEILKNFENKDSRIKIFHNKKNIGLTKSLNILIDNATGKLIARQDADDYSSKDRLSTQVAFLREPSVLQLHPRVYLRCYNFRLDHGLGGRAEDSHI